MAASPHAGTHTEPRFVRKIQQKSHRNVALRFRTSAPSAPAKSIVYVTRPRAKCRRWVTVPKAEEGKPNSVFVFLLEIPGRDPYLVSPTIAKEHSDEDV